MIRQYANETNPSERGSSRRFWLIAGNEGQGSEVMVLEDSSGRLALPVFSFEEEAHLFARYCPKDTQTVVEVGSRELIAALLIPGRVAEMVALDPMPGIDLALVSVGREQFVDSLLIRGKRPA